MGDSHARNLFGAYISNSDDKFVFGFIDNNFNIQNEKNINRYTKFIDGIKNDNLFKVAVYEQAGFFFFKERNGKNDRELFQGYDLDDGLPIYDINEEEIYSTVKYLSYISNILPVIFFGPRIEHHISTKKVLQYGCDSDYRLRPNLVENFINIDNSIKEHVNRIDNNRLLFLSQISAINFDIRTEFMNCDVSYWYDGDHFSTYGEKLFGHRIVQSLIENEFNKHSLVSKTINKGEIE